MSNATIWIVVVNSRNAAICESRDGASHILHTINNEWPRNIPLDPAVPVVARLDRRARREFASELMRALCRGAYGRAYSGLVIVADPVMMEEVRRLPIAAVTRLLIAEIIQDMPDGLVFPANCADIDIRALEIAS